MKSKIARKLILYFAAALVVLSFMIGLIFISLFRAQTIEDNQNNLEARAVSIAGALAEYLSGSESGNMGANGSGKGGYGSYLRFIDDIAMSDVWIVDENLNLISN